MFTADNIRNAQVEAETAESITREIAPRASFVFIGVENHSIYFNVVGRLSDINNEQSCDLQEKTRFELISERRDMIYKAEFKMEMMM